MHLSSHQPLEREGAEHGSHVAPLQHTTHAESICTAGQCVARIQKVRGVEFSYQPPPRNIVPYAAALKGQHPRCVCGPPATLCLQHCTLGNFFCLFQLCVVRNSLTCSTCMHRL